MAYGIIPFYQKKNNVVLIVNYIVSGWGKYSQPDAYY